MLLGKSGIASNGDLAKNGVLAAIPDDRQTFGNPRSNVQGSNVRHCLPSCRDMLLSVHHMMRIGSVANRAKEFQIYVCSLFDRRKLA